MLETMPPTNDSGEVNEKLPNFLSNSPTFSPQQTKQVIADSKPLRGLGPDGLCNVHLYHLGHLAFDSVT